MKNKTTMLTRGALLFGLSAFLYAGAFAQDAPKLTDPEIAHIAVTANQIDVNYAGIAKATSKNKDVLHFAETMERDHGGTIKQAEALAKKLNVTPKDNAMSKSLMEGAAKETKALKALKGAAFDKAYIDNEVAYHKAVLDAIKTALIPQTQNSELKGLLEAVLPVVETHLGHAEMIQKKFAAK